MANVATKASKKAAKPQASTVIPDDPDDSSEDLSYLDDAEEPLPPPIAAQDLIERVTMPRRPGTDVTFDVMMEWLMNVCSEEQRNQIEIYIYRTWPIIMRELDPSNIDPHGKCAKWIDVVQFPYTILDRNYVIGRHGGGKFTFWVNDTSRTERSSNRAMFKSYLDIPITEAEPILNFKELATEDPKNKSYISTLRNRGVLDSSGAVIEKPKESNGESGALANVVNMLVGQLQSLNQQQLASMQRSMPNDAAMQKAIELAAKGGEKSLEFMLAMLKDKKDPLDSVVQLISIMNAAKPKDSEGLSTKDVLLMMQEQSKQQAMMFQTMLENERSRREEKEEKQSISSLVGDIKALRGISDTLGAGGAWWQEAAPFLAQSLGEGFKLVNNIIAVKSGKGVAMTPQQTAQQNFNPKYPPPAKRNAETNPGNPQEQPQQEQQTMSLPEGMDPAFIQQYGMLLVKAMSKGDSGDVFADNLCAILTEAEVSKVQEIGEEKLIFSMQAFPEFWQILMSNFGEKSVRRFVSEFCSYDPNAEDEPQIPEVVS